MEAHNRALYRYKRLNAQVLDVSKDDPVTNKFFAESLALEFPIISNVLGFMAKDYGAYSEKPPFGPDGSINTFGRRTVVVDKKGIVRYIKTGSPDNQEILKLLLKLEKEFRGIK